MAPKPPENNGENTNKKTGKQGKEDICENRPTNYGNGNAHDVGFCVGSDHHQEGVATPTSFVKQKDTHVDIVVKSKVPVDGGAKVVVESDVPADICAEVGIKNKVPVDGGANVVDKSNIPVERGAEVAFKSKVPIDSGAEVAVKSQAADKKHAQQRWLEIIVRGNNEFQHFYANKKCEENRDCETCTKDCECKTCLKVKWLLDHKENHKENPKTNWCPSCQLVDRIRHYHKKVCSIAYCFFCGLIKENENVDSAQACASPVSQSETITEVITQISGGTPLKKGAKFIEGVHYNLTDDLGQGGNGVVRGVELLEPGLEALGLKDDIRLAVKIADVSDNEIKVLKWLADCPNVAVHYFMVNKHQRIPWFNKQTRKKEHKEFEYLLFMQRAEMSLEDYKKTLSGSVLPLKDASIYFRQILEAMVYAHLQLDITHNDIKAGNMLMFLSAGDNLYRAHLCDFEYAIRKGYLSERRGGTRFFMPPEPENGPGRDIYALGIFFLELTIARATYPKDPNKWPEFKRAMVEELKSKLHLRIGILIEACLQQKNKRPKIDYLLKILNEIGGDEGWWPVCSSAVGL